MNTRDKQAIETLKREAEGLKLNNLLTPHGYLKAGALDALNGFEAELMIDGALALLRERDAGGTAENTPAPFAFAVRNEVERARSKHAPLNSAHEAYAVILEELDEFKAEVWKKREQRDSGAMLEELIQLAAMAQRAAEDLKLMPCEP